MRNDVLQAVLSLNFAIFVFGSISLHHAIATNDSQLRGREAVALGIQQQFPEERYHVDEDIVIDRRQKLQKSPTPRLNALRVDLHRRK